ncbi:MAG: histidine kinase dimerization/phosphoacceptor domain -containing protein [bacterium]
MTQSDLDYPLPENEKERLEELREYDILDTPEEPSFDRLTELASEQFDVPIALVSLLDEDRQWFKSYVGTDFRETDRSCAFCNYVLVEENLQVIPDTHKDSRVSQNPLVNDDPRVRFYAGAPIKSDNGNVLGTFCILDTKPREFDANELDYLKLFARETYSQMELRRKNQELERVRKKLETTLETRNTLMNELVHRTKNNFNLITSLFRLQERNVNSEEATEVLEKARNRVRTMSLVQERLHSTEGKKNLSLDRYLRELTRELLNAFEQPDQALDLHFQLEGVTVSSDIAVPLGIILNELVTNAVTHGFDEGTGNLAIELAETDGQISFSVQDDAGNLPDEFNIDQLDSLGLRLVKRLAREQLDGEIEVNNGARTKFTVEFPLE